MDYEMMVKEAYEEIMGIEKEAANGLGGAADYAKKVGLGGAADYAKKVGLGGAADLRGGLNKVLHTPIAAGQYAKKMATYDSDVQFEKEAFAPAPRDFSNLPGSTGPTVPRHKKPKGPWVKSDGTDDNKNDGFIARHLDRAKIY